MKKIFTILLAAATLAFAPAHAQQYAGDWSGNLKVQGISLPIVFHIAETNGSYTATMDSPQQKVFGLQVKSVTASPEKIQLDMSNIGIMFEANMNQDSLDGNFSQAGQVYALVMGRMKEPMVIPGRPQDPRPKFAYNIKEVKFSNEKANVTLAGTLTMPKGKGLFPAVVLVSGSGPQNRDEEILSHKPFWIIADYLTNKGIAVLRYDDRGTAESTGDFRTATSADFAADAQAALAFLRKQPGIDLKKTGVIGHSEGGMIAPMLAAEDQQLGFIILLAGPGIPIETLMLKQNELAIRAAGAPEEEVKKAGELNGKAYDIVIHEPDEAKAKQEVRNLLSAEIPDSNDYNGLVNQLFSPWFRYFIAYNPQPVLEKVKCPVLAVNGDKDLQVTSAENLEGIRQSLTKGGNKRFEIHEIKNKNHLFQTTTTGFPSEYGTIEETFSPEVLKLMANWIKKL